MTTGSWAPMPAADQSMGACAGWGEAEQALSGIPGSHVLSCPAAEGSHPPSARPRGACNWRSTATGGPDRRGEHIYKRPLAGPGRVEAHDVARRQGHVRQAAAGMAHSSTCLPEYQMSRSSPATTATVLPSGDHATQLV